MSDNTDICSICLDVFNDTKNIFITNCNHKFHKECIKNVIEKNCPYCRVELKEKIKEKLKGNITVTIDRMDNDIYDKICNYYNERQTYGKIEKLDRLEGGFCVEIKKEERESTFENDRIRQVRWNKKRLVSNNYKGLLSEEIELLYESMVNILGEEVVIMKQ